MFSTIMEYTITSWHSTNTYFPYTGTDCTLLNLESSLLLRRRVWMKTLIPPEILLWRRIIYSSLTLITYGVTDSKGFSLPFRKDKGSTLTRSCERTGKRSKEERVERNLGKVKKKRKVDVQITVHSLSSLFFFDHK